MRPKIGFVTGDVSPETRRSIVTEQEPRITPDIAPATTGPKAQKPTKQITSAKPANNATSLTDDEKRLARNAALREWRKKNKERVARYMAEWKSRRSGTPQPPRPTAAIPIAAASKPATKKTKPSKATTKKSKAKKGRKA